MDASSGGQECGVLCAVGCGIFLPEHRAKYTVQCCCGEAGEIVSHLMRVFIGLEVVSCPLVEFAEHWGLALGRRDLRLRAPVHAYGVRAEG